MQVAVGLPAMSTSTANPDPTQQAGPDTEPASLGPSQRATTPTGRKIVQQTGDTRIRTSAFTTQRFRAASLSQARSILRDEVVYIINLPTTRLWESYQLKDDVLVEVRKCCREGGWLTEAGKWNGKKIKKERFLTRGVGGNESKTFEIFSTLFNLVQDRIRPREKTTFDTTMVHAGSIGPKSTRVGSHRPDAFLMTSESPGLGKYRWRDLTCPFEYKFGNGCAVDVSRVDLDQSIRIVRVLTPPQNDTKAMWSLLHIMRCDPRRMFSFGSSVRGTMFRIWLLCRAAPFTFTPFDWYKVGKVFMLGRSHI